jgi:hypothetical protein
MDKQIISFPGGARLHAVSECEVVLEQQTSLNFCCDQNRFFVFFTLCLASVSSTQERVLGRAEHTSLLELFQKHRKLVIDEV